MTAWNTRDWMFQDYMLSFRSLIFLEDQICRSCWSAEWYADMDLEALGTTYSWGGKVNLSPLRLAYHLTKISFTA